MLLLSPKKLCITDYNIIKEPLAKDDDFYPIKEALRFTELNTNMLLSAFFSFYHQYSILL